MSRLTTDTPAAPRQRAVLTTVRRLPMSLDQAWDAWTTPGGLQSWWWSEDPHVTCAVDARVGGRYRIHSASTGLGARGTFLALDRPWHLRLQWRWLGEYGPNEDDLVQVSFAVEEEDVVVTLEHTMASDTATERCAERWDQVLDALAGLAPTTQPLVCPRCGCPVDGTPPVCTGLDCRLSVRAHWGRDESAVPLIDY